MTAKDKAIAAVDNASEALKALARINWDNSKQARNNLIEAERLFERATRMCFNAQMQLSQVTIKQD